MSKRLKPSSPQLPLFKKVWYQSFTQRWSFAQLGSAAFLGLITETNNILQSPQFTSVIGFMAVPKYVYLGIAVFGFVTFLAHGRSQNAV